MRSLTPLVAVLVSACAAAPMSPKPPVAPPPPPAAVAAQPTPVVLTQSFAETEPGFSFVDPQRVTKLRSAFADIDGIGAAELARQKLPSLGLAVVIDGELAYVKGFGFADVEHKTPATADTVYRIASITKSFTGMLVLALRDAGKLRLDDPLTRYIPEAAGLVYPTRDAAPITLRQLLTHTSGLPRMGSFPPHGGPTEEVVLKSLSGFALEAAPGSVYTYSNLGFSLLGIAASRAAHMPLRDIMRKRLLAPLGMNSTGWSPAELSGKHVAVAYRMHGDELRPEPLVDLGAAEAGGGIFASTSDLARWVGFQLAAYPPRGGADPGPVKRSSVREAHSTGFASGLWVRMNPSAKKGESPVSAATQAYGFGWATETTCEYDPLVMHSGLIEGFTSEIRLLPKHGVGVVVLANHAGAAPSAVADKMLAALAKTGALKPRQPRLGPAFGSAMEQLLAVMNAWDETKYKAMLTEGRPPHPEEKQELANYFERHGRCTAWKPIEVASVNQGNLALECEKGELTMTVRLGADGLIAGFGGTTHDAPVPKAERLVAVAITKLIARWDDGLYKKHLATAFKDRKETQEFYKRIRESRGKCRVKSSSAGAFDSTILLECERGGDLNLTLTLDEKQPAVVKGYTLRPVGTQGVCPKL